MKEKGIFNRENVTEAVRIYLEQTGAPSDLDEVVESAMDSIIRRGNDADLRLGYGSECRHAKLFVIQVGNHPNTEYSLSTDPNSDTGGGETREKILRAWEEAGLPTNRKVSQY